MEILTIKSHWPKCSSWADWCRKIWAVLSTSIPWPRKKVIDSPKAAQSVYLFCVDREKDIFEICLIGDIGNEHVGKITHKNKDPVLLKSTGFMQRDYEGWEMLKRYLSGEYHCNEVFWGP